MPTGEECRKGGCRERGLIPWDQGRSPLPLSRHSSRCWSSGYPSVLDSSDEQ